MSKVQNNSGLIIWSRELTKLKGTLPNYKIYGIVSFISGYSAAW